MIKIYQILILFFLISPSFGQESDDFSKENKKLFEELSLLSKKKFDNEKTSLKSIESLEPKLIKQDVDSLFGLYHRIKYNHYNNFLKRDLALKSIELSISYYKKANNLKQVALSTMNKGNLFLWQSDNKNALINYFEALKITEKNKFNYQSGLIYKNIGVVFSNQDKQKEALEYANKALQVFLNLKDDEQIAGAYINVGNCYFNQYDANNALDNYKKAEKISIKTNNLENLSFVYNNIGSVYIEDKGDTIQGVNYLKKSIEIRTKLKDLNGLIFSYNNIANIYIGLKKFDLAEENIIKAKEYAVEANNKRELTESFRLLSYLNESKNDYKQALHFHKLYLKQKDSLINEKNNKDVKELDIKYQTEKKEKQILQQQAEVKQKNIWLLLISSFVIIGFILFRNFRAKAKLQKEQLELENVTLVGFSMGGGEVVRYFSRHGGKNVSKIALPQFGEITPPTEFMGMRLGSSTVGAGIPPVNLDFFLATLTKNQEAIEAATEALKLGIERFTTATLPSFGEITPPTEFEGFSFGSSTVGVDAPVTYPDRIIEMAENARLAMERLDAMVAVFAETGVPINLKPY